METAVAEIEADIECALMRPEDLIKGAVYIYTRGMPTKYHGCRYRLLNKGMDVTSRQTKLVIEALDDPDKGRWFVCGLGHFCTRYVPAPPQVTPEKVAGRKSESLGV